ncbi:amidohydrolase [Bifidobacterium tissieri]|uniref:Amidohydrolase n=1 Tax=Bifidobacterium tissieri TaxID=1630162 RepID=A0A5M9ZZT4_9BIFI|nr:amidohydrolase [Bifidobacterium tissieri]KAA8828366.1 amidohydrolase [Bifidobacterium tissieri]KAA8832392.1 amidohydrolase [Bifidobacterium tissieri]
MSDEPYSEADEIRPRLFVGGDILTATPDFENAPKPQALLTDAEGRIVFVGDEDEARSRAKEFDNAEECDLDGAALLPGFIDAHGHLSAIAHYFTTADLHDTKDIDDVVNRLRDFAQQRHIDASGIIIGNGYDQNTLAGGKHPTRHDLDRVSTTIPVVAVHVSGHVLAANTKALEVSGIHLDDPDPFGGTFGRDEDGLINGYAAEGAAWRIRAAAAERSVVDFDELGDATQDVYLSNGITTAQDGASGRQPLADFARFANTHGLRLDVVAYPVSGRDSDGVLADYATYVGETYHNGLRIGGLKVVLDGSPQARTAWVTEPYTPGPEGEGYRGGPSVSEEAVYQAARKTIDNDLQLIVHTNGDAASDRFLDAYERALHDSPNPRKHDLRPVMIHSQLARQDQLERLQQLGGIPSFFVAHTWYWGDVHVKNFGARRGGRISAAGDAKRLGLRYTFHNDSPIIKPNLLDTVWAGATRRTRSGRQLDLDQRVSVADGLRAITANAAYQYGEEHDKGTLEAGKRADLVILEKNPLSVPLDETGAPDDSLRSLHVLETIKNGRTVWTRG